MPRVRPIAPPRRERGYAMVAAVAGIAIMAAMAAVLVQATATRLDTLGAETDRARLATAADAGVELAIANLTRPNLAARWAIDGRRYGATIAGVPVEIRIDDERGKVILLNFNEENMGWLLAALGVDERRRAILVDSYGDWIDDDDEARENGAESEYYSRRGIYPPNNWVGNVEELGEIRGFTPELVRRIAQVATTDAGGQPFDMRNADPVAVQAMTDGDADSVDVLEARKRAAGQRPALAIDSDSDWKNRSVTVTATARGSNGAQATRRVSVRLTGQPGTPYALRWAE